MILREIYNKHFDGKWPDMYTVHSYGEVYETLLEPYRETAKNVLEIGLFSGLRLKIWDEYFKGAVFGIDCDEQPVGGMADLRPLIESQLYNIHIFDACDKLEIENRFSRIKFDVIIEDAAHSIEQQLELYKAWKPYLSENSLYVIEDVQDIDRDREKFLSMDSEKSIEVIDLRASGRYDDVLIVIK